MNKGGKNLAFSRLSTRYSRGSDPAVGFLNAHVWAASLFDLDPVACVDLLCHACNDDRRGSLLYI